jgi:hypothetical protein
MFSSSIDICNINNAAIDDFNLPGWGWGNEILKPNAKHLKNHYNLITRLEDTGFCQLTEKPTRTDNILDLMITNFPNQVSRTEILPGDRLIMFVFEYFPKLVCGDMCLWLNNMVMKSFYFNLNCVPLFLFVNWYVSCFLIYLF